jgi:hypothetical protein
VVKLWRRSTDSGVTASAHISLSGSLRSGKLLSGLLSLRRANCGSDMLTFLWRWQNTWNTQ